MGLLWELYAWHQDLLQECTLRSVLIHSVVAAQDTVGEEGDEEAKRPEQGGQSGVGGASAGVSKDTLTEPSGMKEAVLRGEVGSTTTGADPVDPISSLLLYFLLLLNLPHSCFSSYV